MIRQRIESTFTANSLLVQLPKEFEDIAFETGNEAFLEVRDPTLDLLQIYPPELPNQKYIRTFKLKRGWKVFISRLDRNSFSITISNDVDYTSFVVGSLDQSISLAASFQAEIHRNRWDLATSTVEVAFTDFLESYDRILADKLKAYGTVVRRSI